MGCQAGNRHDDNAGIDAILRVQERFHDDSVFIEFAVDVQLKATSQRPRETKTHYAFDMRVEHYEKARSTTRSCPLLVVVLFLPPDAAEWLRQSEDGLLMKRCAYWVSLYGAPPSACGPKSEQVIYLPKTNVLSVDGLRSVIARISRDERIQYESP
jgi:hypothetical protein